MKGIPPHRQVAFRADASPAMGAGHLARCATLASRLRERGWSTRLITAARSIESFPAASTCFSHIVELPYAAVSAADISSGTWLPVTQAEDAEHTLRAIGEGASWVVADHYGLDANWELQVRPSAKNILVIDDLTNRSHSCDVLLNQNLSLGDGSGYAELVPPTATVLRGPRFALLRDEFRRPRTQRIRAKVGRILVSFGGIDGANGTSTVLAALDVIDVGIAVDVVIGEQHPARDAIVETCARQGYACHVQTTSIADLMYAADLAIGAGGASSWERCIVGLPTITLVMADNQRTIAAALASQGASVNLGDHHSVRSSDIARALLQLCASKSALSKMSEAAYGVMADHVDVADLLFDSDA